MDTPPHARAQPAPALDLAEMRRQFGDEDDLIREVIDLFLGDYPPRLDAIAKAVEAHAPERIRHEAHSLKGAAGNLAAPGVVAAAAALEALAPHGDRATLLAHLARLSTELERLAEAARELHLEAGATPR